MSVLNQLRISGGFIINESVENNFESFINETKLSTADRKSLPDDVYGIVDGDIRKFPLNDKSHISHAKTYFKTADSKYREGLASAIFLRSLDLGLDIKKQGDWFDYLPKEYVDAHNEYFDIKGKPIATKYPHELSAFLDPQGLNESVEVKLHKYQMKFILDEISNLLVHGDKAIPDNLEDLDVCFDGLLNHINMVLNFIHMVKTNIPYYTFDEHFKLNNEEHEKRDPRLKVLNQLYPKVAMYGHLRDTLPSSVYTMTRKNYWSSYQSTFGWNGDELIGIIESEEFFSGILVIDGRNINMADFWRVIYKDRQNLDQALSYGFEREDIFSMMKSYASRSRRNESSYDPDIIQMIPAIEKRAKWLKEKLTSLTLEYLRTGIKSDNRTREQWVEALENEVVLMDTIAISYGMYIWAKYQSTYSLIEELYQKVPVLVKEIDKCL